MELGHLRRHVGAHTEYVHQVIILIICAGPEFHSYSTELHCNRKTLIFAISMNQRIIKLLQTLLRFPLLLKLNVHSD